MAQDPFMEIYLNTTKISTKKFEFGPTPTLGKIYTLKKYIDEFP